jgi:hypothetical protein
MSEAALGARMVRHFFVLDEYNLTVPNRSCGADANWPNG